MYDLSDQNSFTMCCLTHLVFKVVGPGLAVLDPPPPPFVAPLTGKQKQMTLSLLYR